MTGLIIFLVLLGIGYIVGSRVEKNHYKSIIEREQQSDAPLTFAARTLPSDSNYSTIGLVSGSVVISVDYFKVIAAKLRSLVGGRIDSYESLIDRARREAVLRMKADAYQKNADAIFGTRFETASISKGRGKSIGSVEVLVYGTAYAYSKSEGQITQA